ncbi:MAG: 50S ribosomal protein L20 [Candidatus Colwellbacteria bacterium]|nr:50S ribosomal protein L20 [Candidatus Colwellbacteria bacterium]
MPRVKRGVVATRKRGKILKYTKGYKWRRKTHERAAKEALLHAWSHAFRGRKVKKRDFRTLWQAEINAAARKEGTTYSKFAAALKKQSVKLNRKTLAEIAQKHPAVFKEIVSSVLPRA